MGRPGEDELIARYLAPLAGEGALGLLDDAALVTPPPGCDLILTTDALVAGVHFLAGDPPEAIARKALGVNLSDLAAKGADPLGFLLTLALPEDWTEGWLSAFCEGLRTGSAQAACPLLGGDTVRAAGPLTLSITALGAVPTGLMIRRTTARPGDLICVTGTIGDAALGLDLCGAPAPAWRTALDPDDVAFLVDRYRLPCPRLAAGASLRGVASAAMDVSDGLVGDLAKMLRASGVAGHLDVGAVPLSEAARRALGAEPSLLDRILSGGDDYEIVFTASEDGVRSLRDRAELQDWSVSRIGAGGGRRVWPLPRTRRHALPHDGSSLRAFLSGHDGPDDRRRSRTA